MWAESLTSCSPECGVMSLCQACNTASIHPHQTLGSTGEELVPEMLLRIRHSPHTVHLLLHLGRRKDWSRQTDGGMTSKLLEIQQTPYKQGQKSSCNHFCGWDLRVSRLEAWSLCSWEGSVVQSPPVVCGVPTGTDSSAPTSMGRENVPELDTSMLWWGWG